jgi:addiction module RelB/DinJ family antitoxin
MATTTFSVRMDSEVKEQLDAFCSAVGMNTTAIINLFARKVIQEQRIPFEISTRPSAQASRAWGDYAEVGRYAVQETAGGGQGWSNPELIPQEGEASWANAAVAREKAKKHGSY